MESNIKAHSNIFPVKGNPTHDAKFVSLIRDRKHIAYLINRKPIDPKIAQYSSLQAKIYGREYDWDVNDPTYAEDTKDCITPPEERDLYKDMKYIKKFYLVDLVSEDEKLLYDEVENDEVTYAPIEVPEEETDYNTYKYDENGKKMIIVGYEKVYFGDADEQLQPIWDYADRYDKTRIVRSKFGSTSAFKQIVEEDETKKAHENLKEHTIVIEEPQEEKISIEQLDDVKDYDEKEILKLKLAVVESIESEIKLTELDQSVIDKEANGNKVVIVAKTPSEKAYISSMLIKADISHGIGIGESKVNLLCISELGKEVGNCKILLTKALIDSDISANETRGWDALQNVKGISKLLFSDRGYFSVDLNGEEVWGCSNLMGITHICIEPDDIVLSEKRIKQCNIVFQREEAGYTLYDDETYDIVGETTKKFELVLECLRENDYLEQFPDSITGISIVEGSILGIGHMKFREY